MKKFIIRMAVVLAVILCLSTLMTSVLLLNYGRHINPSPLSALCPKYLDVAPEYTVAPLDAPSVSVQHPYLATEGNNGMHSNSYNTGAYDYDAPVGRNTVVDSRSMGFVGGMCATTMFDSKGRMICISGKAAGFSLMLMDPDTLDVLCEAKLPPRASTAEAIRSLQFSKISEDTSGGAYCHLLKGDRPIIANSANVIQIYSVDESGPVPQWKIDQQWDIMPLLPEGSYLTDAIPDYDGNIWFVTRPGEVGYIEKALITEDGSEAVHLINLSDLIVSDQVEEIQNTLAVCADGVYIVSDHAMYRFEVDGKKDPVYTWRTEYDRGTTLKPGAINQGSGTTPTLLDCERSDGSIAHLVAITDNADGQINVVVYDRENGNVLAEVPCFTEGKSVSENSLIAYGRSFIVENNYSEKGAAFLALNPSSERGIWRIDMNADCDGASVAWRSDEMSCTVVPKLSTKTGLIYLYTREYSRKIPGMAVAWYLTAIDFRSGETVFKVHTGNGIRWNNSYGPITIGPNGTAYVGVFNGIVSVHDEN